MMVVSAVSSRAVERYGTKAVVATGLTIGAIAMVGLSRLEVATPMVQPLGVMAVMWLGMGLMFGPATASLTNSVPKERAGVGSAMNDTTRQCGGALGVAVFGYLLASRYHAS